MAICAFFSETPGRLMLKTELQRNPGKKTLAYAFSGTEASVVRQTPVSGKQQNQFSRLTRTNRYRKLIVHQFFQCLVFVSIPYTLKTWLSSMQNESELKHYLPHCEEVRLLGRIVLNASRHAKTQAWVLVAAVITLNTLFLYLMLIGSNAKMFLFH